MTQRGVKALGTVVAALCLAAVAAWVHVWPSAADEQAPPPPAYRPPVVKVWEGVQVDQAEAAAVIAGMANDPRGWRTDLDQWTVLIVPPGIGGIVGMGGRIGEAHPDRKTVLVADVAWTTLGPKFGQVGGTLDDQRTWVVLHELGHLLGHGHTECPGSGPSPVMRSWNYRLGDGCTFNVWPNPAA